MTRVLVTGAAGFVGSHLCEHLVRQGHLVRGVDALTPFYDPARKRANLAALLGQPAFELVTADLLEADLGQLLDGVDAVAHLAGEPGVPTSWGPSFQQHVTHNIVATQRLLEAVVEHGVVRFVHASSAAVYGAAVDSLRAHGEPRPASPYAVSELAAETLVGAYAHTHGLPAVSLRYFTVYGPRQRPDMAVHRFIEALLRQQPLQLYGDGRQVRDFVYVDDVVDATDRALFTELPPGSVLDVAGGRPVAVGTLIAHLNGLTGGGPVLLEQLDERPGDVPRSAGQIRDARQQLGWSPRTDLHAGLLEQIAWHRSLIDQALDPEPVADGEAATLSEASGA
jgi:nucleoside-diphosphate-sugar epimerase